MHAINTNLIADPIEVEMRLEKLHLNKDDLISVARDAFSARHNITVAGPKTGPGLLSYLYGTEALRIRIVGEQWDQVDVDNIALIRNDELKIQVVFQNVDVASSLSLTPKPTTKKGAGSERASKGNMLFDELPQFVSTDNSEYITYSFMVAPNGASELSQAVIKDGTFVAFIERIFITDASDFNDDPIEGSAPSEIASDFEINVTKKAT
ncbi:hypothetical protein [Pseudovibrio sp. POLY-S9]|uniref:hypothetical protein n=1 Tax=Pseudovibrio sp. POLY-S9 TaxID=1576596 RepID=UPI00070ACC4B|nr:hypothetical protein [Pseudovibrio sp. POLY-S9]